MPQGQVTIKVRPLRIAYLVDPADRHALQRATELATFFWGGSYSPIIPVYRRTPKHWHDLPLRRLPPMDIVDGYLAGFDPDIVVPLGRCTDRKFDVGNRSLATSDELLGDIAKTGVPRYGVGFFEVLNDFVRKELKYQRADDLQVAFPRHPRTHKLYLSSVFGALPAEVSKLVDDNFVNSPGVSFPKPTLDGYINLLSIKRLYPRHISAWGLENRPGKEAKLFLCDATSPQDIIDYWNLRAAGYYTMAIPIQIAKSEVAIQRAREFITDNYQPYRHNDQMFHRTIILRSRSISEQAIDAFHESLRVADETLSGKHMVSAHYPRIWDAWARENTSENVAFPYSHEVEKRINDDDNTIHLRAENPRFSISSETFGKPKFANEFRFSYFGAKEPMAEVFPEGGPSLASAVGPAGYRNWRFSNEGPVFLADRESDWIFIDPPRAEAVMVEWFKERGWTVSLSGPGRIAAQLIKQLGGVFGISWIAHLGVIKLLGDLEKDAGMPRPAIMERLKQVIRDDELFFDNERFLELLLKANALRLGARIQCTVCTRHNWYELNALEYRLVCRFCLSDFSTPVQSPKDMVWTYRAHGPFATSIAQGSFTVLLTLRFLSDPHDRGLTPLLSYVAKKDGRLLEADLTCLYRRSSWKQTAIRVVHVECKSFNRFELRDVDRMRDLATEFPGSILVFSTLNESLSADEVSLIKRFTIAERKKQLQRKLSSRILILTGTELFSDRGLEGWKGRGGLFDQLYQNRYSYWDIVALTDATQQLYLGLPAMARDERMAKRRAKPKTAA